MIPQAANDLLNVSYDSQPSYTYEINTTKENVVGYCQGVRAVEQAIYKILNTERYENAIYSWNYGVELAELIGKPTSYCLPEIERRITEALMQDDRISSVSNFTFSYPKKGVIVTCFDVTSSEGNLSVRKEVSV